MNLGPKIIKISCINIFKYHFSNKLLANFLCSPICPNLSDHQLLRNYTHLLSGPFKHRRKHTKLNASLIFKIRNTISIQGFRVWQMFSFIPHAFAKKLPQKYSNPENLLWYLKISIISRFSLAFLLISKRSSRSSIMKFNLNVTLSEISNLWI